MDAKNQFTVFLASIAVGFVGGVFYEIFAFLRGVFGCEKGKNKILGNSFDIVFCILFAVFCIFASFLLHFPSFRGYMWLGFGLGGALYAKTLRRIVAFLEKVCYNMIRKLFIKAKSKKKLSNLGDKEL